MKIQFHIYRRNDLRVRKNWKIGELGERKENYESDVLENVREEKV